MNLSVTSFLFALAAVLGLAACSKTTPATDANASILIRLGHAAPLTGPQAHLGKDNENGARLAVEDANAANLKFGGRAVTFELTSEDDQSDPRQGNLVAQKFVDAKVNAVIGHLNSGTTIPASRLYATAGIPQVSPSATNPTYTEQGFKTAFRVMANDVQQGKVLGMYAVNNLHAKTVAVIDDKTAYGEGLATEFKKAAIAAGATVVAEEHTDDKSVDFKSILTTIKGKQPDLIFFGGMDPQAAPMARQIKQLGVPAKFLLGDGGCNADFIKNAADASAGCYCSLPGVPLAHMSGGAKFSERYKARFNANIQSYAPYAYDAAMVLIEAAKRAQSGEPASILAELPKTDYNGVTAHIQFDAKGDLKDGVISLYVGKNGAWEPLETISTAVPQEDLLRGVSPAPTFTK